MHDQSKRNFTILSHCQRRERECMHVSISSIHLISVDSLLCLFFFTTQKRMQGKCTSENYKNIEMMMSMDKIQWWWWFMMMISKNCDDQFYFANTYILRIQTVYAHTHKNWCKISILANHTNSRIKHSKSYESRIKVDILHQF